MVLLPGMLNAAEGGKVILNLKTDEYQGLSDLPEMIEDYKKSSTFNQKTLDRYVKTYRHIVSIYYKLYVLTGNPKWKPPDFPLII